MSRKRHPPTGAQPGTLMIPEQAEPPRIRVMAYAPDDLVEQDVQDPAELATLLKPGRVCWIDVQGLGDETVLRELTGIFGIHPLALEDIVNIPQRPKIETFDNHALIIIRLALLEDKAKASREQVSLVIGDGFVMTFQERYGQVFDAVRTRIRQGGPVFRSSGSEYLAYALVDAAIDTYFPVLEHFGEHLETIEEQIMTSPQQHVIGEIHDIKRELLAIRRALWPIREVVNTILAGDSSVVSDKVRVHFRDCYDHCVQLIDMVETSRELTGGLMDFYLSSVANRQNEVMNTLTVVASIFIPLSFLAGIYGMNFDNMPELHTTWGYPVLLAGMAAAASAMFVFFRRKGWIRRRTPWGKE